MKRSTNILVCLSALLGACKDQYDPPVKAVSLNYLVVEGMLNVGAAPTRIHLSRTFQLSQTATAQAEYHAQLAVEGEDSSVVGLVEAGNGDYVADNLHLIANNKYRLRIRTTNGKEYLSDYVMAKITPPIDSVNWRRNNSGVQIYVNTKDPANATHYYRWEYEETWQIQSRYLSKYIYENGQVRLRHLPEEDYYTCWKFKNSSSILIANSTRLQEDVIFEQPIMMIPTNEERISVRYSILVKQYALEEGAYDFYELLKKNTENVGSLFNPLPSEVKGNIHCISDPSEVVVGYVTSSTAEEKRIFISQLEVVPWAYNLDCPFKVVVNNPDTLHYYFIDLGLIPFYFNNPPGDYYHAARTECIDCRRRGGVNVRPSYW